MLIIGNKIKDDLNDFLNLFFPNLCRACGTKLIGEEETICFNCLYHLPKTNYHLFADNPVEQTFWGRINLEAGTSFCFFEKGTPIQHLLHQLKYNDEKEIGMELGKHLGAQLASSERFQSVDVLIPVPLHPKKEKKRGYNQSEWIAKGISQTFQRPINTDILVRKSDTSTQTHKSRFERWENVSGIFTLNKEIAVPFQHILLIDDVITTGATLEACASKFLELDGIKVSIATLTKA